jgi:hypothetical protein
MADMSYEHMCSKVKDKDMQGIMVTGYQWVQGYQSCTHPSPTRRAQLGTNHLLEQCDSISASEARNIYLPQGVLVC